MKGEDEMNPKNYIPGCYIFKIKMSDINAKDYKILIAAHSLETAIEIAKEYGNQYDWIISVIDTDKDILIEKNVEMEDEK